MDEMKMVLTAPNITCHKCGSKLFREAIALKKISAIISPTGKEEIVPVPMYVCMECGEIPEEYQKMRNFDIIMGNKTEEEMQEDKKPSIIMP